MLTERDPAPPSGTRVVVRYALPTPDPQSGARLTDVIGMLVESTEERIVVDADAGRVRIPRSAVVATRIIPPRPARRGAAHRALSIEDLERVMIEAWPPVERAHLGDWVLRFGNGFTQRANSALVLGHPDRPVASALQAVRSWYAVRALPPRLSIPWATGGAMADDDIVRAALRTGWSATAPVLVMTADVRTVLASTQEAAGGIAGLPARSIDVTDRMSDEWFGVLCESRPSSRGGVEAVLHGSPLQRFAVARGSDGGAVGIARVGVAAGWAGLGAMWVHPGHRRQGVGRSLLHAAARQATAHGCVSMHLQVESSNASALALYESAGFTTHHRYAYLTAAGA